MKLADKIRQPAAQRVMSVLTGNFKMHRTVGDSLIASGVDRFVWF